MVEHKITKEQMQHVYDAMKTPIKYGPVLFEEGANIDCPNIFRRPDGTFAMAYANMFQVPNARVMKPGLQLQMICSTGHRLENCLPIQSLVGTVCRQMEASVFLIPTGTVTTVSTLGTINIG